LRETHQNKLFKTCPSNSKITPPVILSARAPEYYATLALFFYINFFPILGRKFPFRERKNNEKFNDKTSYPLTNHISGQDV
jgi:hypothetical protein